MTLSADKSKFKFLFHKYNNFWFICSKGEFFCSVLIFSARIIRSRNYFKNLNLSSAEKLFFWWIVQFFWFHRQFMTKFTSGLHFFVPHGWALYVFSQVCSIRIMPLLRHSRRAVCFGLNDGLIKQKIYQAYIQNAVIIIPRFPNIIPDNDLGKQISGQAE